MTNELELLLAEIDFLKSELGLQNNLLDEKIFLNLASEYTFESNRLEGSTITLPETELALKIGMMIPGKSMAEYLSVANHYQAIQFICSQAEEETIFSESLIKEIHSILLKGVNKDHPGGVYRDQSMAAANGRALPSPEDLPVLMRNMVNDLRIDGPFMHPALYAAEVHQRLLAIQPFAQANGICARLLMNLILHAEGYPLVNIRGDDTSRQAYTAALEQVHGGGDKNPWYRLIADQLMVDIKSLLKRLQEVREKL